MRAPQARPTRQSAADRQAVRRDGRGLGDTDAVTVRGDAPVEIGERLSVIEPPAFRHEGFDQPVGAMAKPLITSCGSMPVFSRPS